MSREAVIGPLLCWEKICRSALNFGTQAQTMWLAERYGTACERPAGNAKVSGAASISHGTSSAGTGSASGSACSGKLNMQ